MIFSTHRQAFCFLFLVIPMQPCGIYGAVQRDFFFLPGKKKESAGSILTPSTIFDSLVKKKKKKSALNATISTSKTAMSQTIVDNRMRYAKKSPEERKSTKFSQAACLNEDTCSSGADVNADLSGEANPAPPEPKQDKPKKKCSRKRPRTSEEAQMAHIYGDVTRL